MIAVLMLQASLQAQEMPGTQEMPQHQHHQMSMQMDGALGKYPMTRESSGTSWQPESTPMGGLHFMRGDWMFMVHGFADVVYDHQGGGRGADKTISPNMLMLMAQNQQGLNTFGVRTMLSLEPTTIGRSGYPLLLQTGETANGRDPLIDRQHPHDLFMELAATYSRTFDELGMTSAFVYVGYPGEPTLGPATFMHRFSGEDNPEAPITHHWLDSTHITWGVATAGVTFQNFKLEGSIFTGREPDEQRWCPDPPKFDSQSARLSFNPTSDWSLQISYGHINSPEQLEPDVGVDRLTASATHNLELSPTTNWQTMIAWGQNNNEPGHTLNGYLIETALRIADQHTIFARYENVAKDELFGEGESFAGKIFTVNKLSIGYIYDFARWHGARFGVGALGSIYFLPEDLQDFYGSLPTSYMLFARVKL
jgi:hypothetical protein